jgi:hypothetical protein
MVRQHDAGNPLPADADEGRHEAMAPCPILRPTDQAGGEHEGALGHSRSVLQVLHTLIFDFLNYQSGRLDPSHAPIAHCELGVPIILPEKVIDYSVMDMG